jgi:hypothetical protein
VKHILPADALKTLYYSIFHCHLIYAIQIWSSTTSSNYKGLFQLQKTAIRIINNAKYNAHTEPLFKSSEILPLPDLVDFFKLQFMQRCVQKFSRVSFEDVWIRNSIRREGENEILLRNNDLIHIPFSRLASTDKQPLISFPRLWENFPDVQLKFIRNKNEFDSKLKQYFLNKLSDAISCGRLYCYSCSNR